MKEQDHQIKASCEQKSKCQTDLNDISSEQDQQSQEDSHQALFSESSYDNEFQKDINKLPQKKKVIEQSEKPQEREVLKEQNAQQDSIEIIAVKPAKISRNSKNKQRNDYEEKQQKRKKKQKRIKKKKKSKYKSKQKNKKKSHKKSISKKKHKKSRKQRKDKRKKSKMKIQIDSPPITSPLIQNKMNNRVGSKSVHPPQRKRQLVLIEKNQIEDAELDLANRKILQNIVATINKGPPPQAPRQYRKAGTPIDFKIQPALEINQNFNTILGLGEQRGNGQSQTARQNKINQANKILTTKVCTLVSTDENYTNFLAKLSAIGTQQEKSKISKVSNTAILSMDFQKIREKADWQKLKQKLISSNRNERQNQQDSKLVVISLDNDQGNQSQTFVSMLKSKLQQENNQPFSKGQSNDQRKYFKLKNEKIKIDVASKKRSFGELNSGNPRVKYLQNAPLQIQQKIFPSRISSNPHLTRKYCNEHHQQVKKGGIIDLQIDEFEETQAIFHRRDQSFSNLPIDPSESLIKFIDKHKAKVPEGQKVYHRFEQK